MHHIVNGDTIVRDPFGLGLLIIPVNAWTKYQQSRPTSEPILNVTLQTNYHLSSRRESFRINPNGMICNITAPDPLSDSQESIPVPKSDGLSFSPTYLEYFQNLTQNLGIVIDVTYIANVSNGSILTLGLHLTPSQEDCCPKSILRLIIENFVSIAESKLALT